MEGRHRNIGAENTGVLGYRNIEAEGYLDTGLVPSPIAQFDKI